MQYIEILAGLVFFAAAMGMFPLWPVKPVSRYRVYHSDSCKYFDADTLKDATEWMNATYDDAILFCGWTGETLEIVTRRTKA